MQSANKIISNFQFLISIFISLLILFSIGSFVNAANTDFTISAWVKLQGATTTMAIVAKDNEVRLVTDSANNIVCQIHNGTAWQAGATSSSALSQNEWAFASCVYDGASLKIYINGIEKASVAEISDVNNTTNVFRIGSDESGDYNDFSGLLDEVKIYPYARTADQVKQDYNAGLAGMSTKKGTSASFGDSSDKWMSDGLVGYWKFDETATTSGAIDSSGNSNNGIYYGNASTTGGKFGNGGVFDGDGDGIASQSGGDYIDIDSLDSTMNITNSFSVFAWFKTSTDSKTIVSDYNEWENTGEVVGWKLDIYSGFLSFQSGFGYDILRITGNTNVLDNEWHYAGAITDGNQVFLYLDGEMIGEGSIVSSTFTDQEFRIGKARTYGTFPTDTLYSFVGNIDEVRAYNRALSKLEVKKLYEWAPGPVLHLKMDEKSGTHAYDSSGYGNNGVLDGNDKNPEWTRGKYGGGLHFDGVNRDFIWVGSASIFDNMPAITLEAWVKISNFTAWDTYIGKAYDSASSYEGWTFENGGGGAVNYRYEFQVDYSDTNLQIKTPDNTAVVGKWQYIAVTWDGSKNYSGAHIYADGIDVGYGPTVNAVGNRVDDSNRGIGVGNLLQFGSEMRGDIDDVRIYNYPRTQKQILEDMNGGGPAVKSPVLYLSFDEGRGSIAHDSSIYGNDGTLNNGGGGSNTTDASMWDKNGKVGGAMEFDGTDDYVGFGDVADMGTGDFTLAVWIKTDSISKNIIEKRLNSPFSNPGYTMLVNQSGRLGSSVQDGSAKVISTDDGIIVADDNWHYALIVFSKSGGMIRYVDGERSGSADDISSIGNIDNSKDLDVGRFWGGGSGTTYFHGLIDEVKIWNYALSEDEIKQEYNSGSAFVMGEAKTADNNGMVVTGASTKYCVPGDTATCSPPVLELKMDEKTGNTAYDTSGNGNDGTIHGASWGRGKIGSALSFDGVDDYVSTGYVDNIYKERTYLAWIYMKGYGENDNDNIYNLFSFFDISVSSSSQLLLRDQNYNLSNDKWSSPDNSLSLNKWNYIVVVDTSSPSFYINGVKVLATQYSFHSGMNITGSGNTTIGGPKRFNGIIDDFKIYNYARTPAQIAWDYNKGKPIAHYKFDECTGSVIHDATDNKNHGTLNLGTTGVTTTGTCASSSNSFWYNGRTGKKNSGGSFDGTSDFVDLGGPSTLKPTSVTVSAWAKIDTTALQYQRIISAREATGFTGYILSFTDGKPRFIIGDGSDFEYAITNSDVAVPTGIWKQYLGTFDASNDIISLYIDGKLVGTSSQQAISYSGDLKIYIGAEYNSGSTPEYMLDGQIDDVRIYNYALTAEQVKNVYNDGAVSFK